MVQKEAPFVAPHLKINTNTDTFTTLLYKVADITLADYGRKEIELAEKEMPGLYAKNMETQNH